MGMFRERQRGWLEIKLEIFLKSENYLYKMSNNFRPAGKKELLLQFTYAILCISI